MSNVHGLVDPTPEGARLEAKLANRRRVVTDFLCGLAGRDDVIQAFDDAGLAWGELREHGEVLDTPTIAHRGTVVQVDDRDGGERDIVRSPYRMSETDTSVCTPRLRPSDRDMPERPWIDDFSSGYMQRMMPLLPRQGDREPWTNPQRYSIDKKVLRNAPLEDGAYRRSDAVGSASVVAILSHSFRCSF